MTSRPSLPEHWVTLKLLEITSTKVVFTIHGQGIRRDYGYIDIPGQNLRIRSYNGPEISVGRNLLNVRGYYKSKDGNKLSCSVKYFEETIIPALGVLNRKSGRPVIMA